MPSVSCAESGQAASGHDGGCATRWNHSTRLAGIGMGLSDVDAVTHRQLVKLCIKRGLSRLELRMARILLDANGEASARQFVDDVTPVVQAKLVGFDK